MWSIIHPRLRRRRPRPLSVESLSLPLPGQKAPCNQRGLLYQKYSVFMILYNVYPQCERAGRIKVERSWRAGTNTFNKTTNVLYYSIRVRHRDEFADCQAGLLSGIIAGCHVVESQRQIRWQWDGRSSPRSLQQAMLCQWQSIECVPSPQDTSGPQVVRCLLVCWSTHMLSKHVLYPGRTVEQVLPVRLTQTFDTFPLPCAQKFFDVVSLLPPRKQNPQSSVTHLRTSS